MQLTQNGNRFVLASSYEERHIPKEAGFRWNPAEKKWWTDDRVKAARLIEFATPELKVELAGAAALHKVREKAEEERKAVSREESRATDADITLPCPQGLAYLPYQRAGIAFALKRENTLIGDDMGLGKTIQAIGLFNADPSIKKVLIICPASLKLNWQREWRKWATRRCYVAVAEGKHYPRHVDIVIINYDIVAKHRPSIDLTVWDLLIVDECHALKNSKAQRTRAVFGAPRGADPIYARRRVFLTGTPILNKPAELWTLVQSLDPKGLGKSYWGFHGRYCNATRGRYGTDISGASNLEELQDRLRSGIMVRRLKSEVLTELPPKRRQVMEMEVPSETRALIEEEREKYRKNEDQMDELRAKAALAEAAGDEASYRDAVGRLRAIQKVAFQEISRLRHLTAQAKIPLAIEHLEEVLQAGKVVAFAHHQDVIHEIAKHFGDQCVVITGQTKIEDRQANVDRFQSDPACRLFLGNILAAGVGLTLTASSHVVMVELDWRPGIVTQAEDRCHRIGQRDCVYVQHLVFNDSLDALMAKRIVAKQEVIEQALDNRSDYAPVQEEDPLEGYIAEALASPGGDTPNESAKDARTARPDKPLPELSPQQVDAVVRGLRVMAGNDPDHARELNGVGFNRFDNLIGHSLAQCEHLTIKQAVLGRKILRKYVRQLGEDLIQAMGR